MKIAICDDEKIILEEVKKTIEGFLKSRKVKYTISIYTSGEDLLRSENLKKLDAVFLDIELQGMNGIEVAKVLREEGVECHLVFVTSYMNYVFDGYKVEAFRYILKANLKMQMEECIASMLETFWEGLEEKSFGDISAKDILYVMSENHKITVFLRTGEEKFFYMTLNRFEEEMNAKFLCRLHQSYLVNMKNVEFVKRYEAKLSDGSILPISKARYKEVSKEIGVRRRLWN